MIRGIILILTAIILSCSPPPDPDANESKIDEVKLWINHDELVLNAAPVLSELVHLDIFAGLAPGLMEAEAKQRFGRPQRITTDYRGTFFHYVINGHPIAVAHLESSSMGAKWEDWSIYAFPTNPNVNLVFTSPVSTALRNRSGEVVLMVISNGKDMRVGTDLKNNHVTNIRLYEVD